MALLAAPFLRGEPRRARRWRACTSLASLLVATLALGVLAAPGGLRAQNAPSKEYQIKAVFLYNFLQFATWPDTAFPDAHSPIRIGILGEDPFGGALMAAVQDEKVGQRAVIVERFSRPQDMTGCHVVFASKSEAAHVPAIIAAFAGKPVLTVGDMPDFARRGGIINFHLEGAKVRFEINRWAAQRSGFKLSSQLLGLARLVGPAPEPSGG